VLHRNQIVSGAFNRLRSALHHEEEHNGRRRYRLLRERADSERHAAARTDDPYVRATHYRLAETYADAARLREDSDPPEG
jgi:hypothetical protein